MEIKEIKMNKKIFFEISSEYEDIKLTFANGDSYNIKQ